MLPGLMPGAKYSADLATLLEQLALDASNARTSGASGALLDKYFEFADEAARQLTSQLTPRSIEQLILTDAYWRAHAGRQPSAWQPHCRT